ncbi:MAG: YifB family Mg chelatase-like AAA ATPase [Alphaproteobacteria bacterium]|jgi:magnesium chelatase family protein|nr:YifB family Mg chelatase-like AAA ATPase [Alphaproteobacteria bacterium]
MVARVQTVAFHGIEIKDIDVQVQITSGLPAFSIVGLPDKAVAESRERVRSALHSLGISLPANRIIINLAPANVVKEGSHFDLPIALGLLSVLGVIPNDALDEYVVVGELALDAGVSSVNGVLPSAIHAMSKDKGIICPKNCGSEAMWAGDSIDVLAPANLLELINHFKGTQSLETPDKIEEVEEAFAFDMSDVKGQEIAKRALEIVAAGGHNMLMVGPPGSGKSMLASRLPSILPPLTARESLETSMIHSIAGMLEGGKILRTRPYRDPHHSASLPSLIGGGAKAKPGEVSIAHNGVLFLDELPEFSRQSLETLRQPLETKKAVISRANSHITYPADFQLICAMNPCKCGYFGDKEHECSRAPKCAIEYQNRISGPLYDRIDVHVEVSAVKIFELAKMESGEDSATIRKRVLRARKIQEERYKAMGLEIRTNSLLSGKALEEVCKADSDATELLNHTAEKMGLSARAYYRILKVARTIADMEAKEVISKLHIAEALSYRRKKIVH